MSAFTNYGETLLLKYMFTTEALTRPTAWYVALHTGDPGEVGTANEVVVGTDADYVRKSLTFTTPTADQAPSASAVSWTVNSGSGGYTVTHISICDASTSGNVLMKGALAVPRVLVANGVLTFEIGEIIAALD